MNLITVIVAAIVGAALSVSGATLQSVLRNPLAEPYILGLVGGSSLGVALVFATGVAAAAACTIPIAAFAGACTSLGLVFLVSHLSAKRSGSKAVNGQTVVISGFVAGSFTCSLQMLVLSYATSEESAAAYKWVWGDLHQASRSVIPFAIVAVAAAAIILYSQNRKLNALVLGEETASSLGVNVKRTQMIVFCATSLATAAAVALAGAVGFIGLIVPHIIRRLAGINHRIYLPLCAVTGALFLIFADAISYLFPGSIPVGVVCALIGAPFFFFLLVRPARNSK